MAEMLNAYRPAAKGSTRMLTRQFKKEDWDALPASKYGWKLRSEEPAEVTKLKALAGKANAAGTSKTEKSEKVEKLNAADLAAKIYEAETADEIDELIATYGNKPETRSTVTTAREKALAALAEAEKEGAGEDEPQ